ncbi:hypothetical protein [Streptomyces sp. NPDC005953]|uniref:hypothetical protein n=1 Tax=unclassified Streptomyces TaxID=2593676 RepID=UPI0033EE8E46
MTSYYRDERAALHQPTLLSVSSQGVDEGYRLVGPGGRLTAVVEDVLWLDNHPAGPDTHVVVSFEDGTQVEFPFDVPLTAVWHAESRPLDEAELALLAPAQWGEEGRFPVPGVDLGD